MRDDIHQVYNAKQINYDQMLMSLYDINESFNKYNFVNSYGLPEELARFVSI